DPQDRLFTEIRNNSGLIIHDAKLGGAWGYVDLVIGTFGAGANGGNGLATCGAFCPDLRDTADTWAAPKRTWRMPDVLINQVPQTVMVSQAGTLSVFSSDHPQAALQNGQQASFSFKTFGASVSVDQMSCPGVGGPPVQVIKGVTSLAMPGMGSDSDPSYAITAAFTLCASALREATLTFQATPGIPVAQPPALWVQLIGGKVTLNPDYARINVDIGFFVGDAVTEPKPFKGTATLTIDTRGLFDLQAKGRIMGVMDGDAHLWVAWNPLDTGMGAQGFFPSKDNWVMQGYLYGHIWRGSGWQNRYPWLAGNDDFHMTASYKAEFKLKEGAISSNFLLDIPPKDVVIGVELSFGQFCANDGCTAFQWGIKGKVNVLDFDVGVYVNLDCIRKAPVPIPPVVLTCTSFILGSDGHILIDQYGPGGPPFPAGVQAREPGQTMPFSAEQAT
ncbi:MAG TPA: hypothetical protein VFT99_07480, partial [Roseiflexaceae bacterium]|nr:hypothetical protein [Roseiflexaceae bacterium]